MVAPTFLRLLLVANVALMASAAVLPRMPAGTQFITGVCKADADCASGCCGFKSGKCAGAIIAQERDGGCGFGSGTPNNNAAVALVGAGAPKPAGGAGAPPPPASSPAKAPGTQFITGVCKADGDCASGCCGFKSGKCAGAIIAQERDGGCGFGNPTPNNNAAVALVGAGAPKPAGGAGAPPPPAAAPAPPASSPAKAPGTQFITGVCKADADCASGCCGFKSGKCAGAIIAQERDGGCGFGNPTPNNNAAVALVGAGAPKPAGGAGAPPPPPPPASSPAKAPGTQFITGECKSDADCASGCCAFRTGKCAGAVIAQSRDGGCGFGNPVPNNDAAKKIQGPNAEKAPGVPRRRRRSN